MISRTTTSRTTLAALRWLQSPGLPLAIWLVAFATGVTVSLEHLIGDVSPAILQVPAKITAYASATASILITAGMLVGFGLACAAALRWLDGDFNAPTVARAVALGTWALAAHSAVTAVAVVAYPPTSATTEELMALSAGADAAVIMGLPWLSQLQYATGAAFLLTVFLSLSRGIQHANAIIAVAFAAATIAFVGGMLRLLAGAAPLP